MFCLVPLASYRASGDISSSRGFLCAPDLPAALMAANAHHRDTEEPVVAVEVHGAPPRWEQLDTPDDLDTSGNKEVARVHGTLDRAAIEGAHYARREVTGHYLGFHRRGPTAEEFDLLPHPEGGWYRRTWTGSTELTTRSGARPAATAILFLLAAGETSQWHTVASDELWLWHRGTSLLLELAGTGDQPASSTTRVTLGSQAPQALVPAGTWQRALASTDEALVSCVVSPGFDFADFRALPS